MKKRPLSVSIIGWLLLIGNGIGLLSMVVFLNNSKVQEVLAKNPLPVPVHLAISFGVMGCLIAASIGMLRGDNRGRILYATCGALALTYNVITSPMKTSLIPSVLFFLVVIVFLYRPRANEFFSTTPAAQPQDH